MSHLKWEKGSFVVDTDPARLDIPRIHRFLSESYWAKGIPIEIVRRSIVNSLNFGIYSVEGEKDLQVGFARVVTDSATFAYLADVYVEEAWRGNGLAKWLMECIQSHSDLQGLRRYCLGTRDAHGLYRKFGYEVIRAPENWMEIRVPDIYLR